jgi:hypothetical protein
LKRGSSKLVALKTVGKKLILFQSFLGYRNAFCPIVAS